jgi:adenylate cyclase
MQILRRLRPVYSLRSTIFAFIAVGMASLVTLFGLVPSLPSFEFLELKAIDAAFNLRGPRPPVQGPDNNPRDPNESLIVIVAIDDESIRESGQGPWPWPRAYLGQIISQISKSKPALIATDIFWYESTNPEDDQALGDAIAQAGNVILANDINRVISANFTISELRTPIKEIRDSARYVGLANLNKDSDGFIRSMPLFDIHDADGQAYFSWSAYALFDYFNAPPPQSIQSGMMQVGDLQVPLNDKFVIVNYRGDPAQVFDQVPAYQVANGEVYEGRGSEYFKDKIVLIGATTESLHDTYPTPFLGSVQPMPGVEIHANVIDTVISRQFMYRWPVAIGAVVALIMGLLAFLLSGIPIPVAGILIAVATTVAYLILWQVAFLGFNTEIYVIAPLSSFLLGYTVPSVERAISEQIEKRRVRSIFERFVSPEMVGQMLDRGVERMRGQRTELTILFSDIRGFTTLSENMNPEEIVDMLNEYLGVMTDVIYKYGGTIDKYEGDLIMAVFNAPLPQPDHARRAVEAAIDMRQTLDGVKARWAKESSRPTNFEMGIGINSGEAFVGLIGAEKRINYTCIGDSVNLASRVQDLTKDLRWPLLITQFTYEQIKDHFDCEFAESYMVKGKTVPVGMYRVLGRKGAPEAERIRALFA